MATLTDRADRFVQGLFARPRPQPPEEEKTDSVKLLRRLRRRQEELSRIRRKI